MAKINHYKRELSVALVYVLLLLILGLCAPGFYQGNQLRSILVSSAPILVAAVGMTLVILARHIDISIGSQVSFCAVVAGLLAQGGLPMPLVVLAAVATGGALGAVNGIFIAGLGLPSIVVTLAMLVILGEGLRWWREGELIRNLPAGFQWLGLDLDRGQWVIIASALIVCGLFAWGLHNLAAGRVIYATGSDPEAARLAGIRPRRVVFVVFVVMGMLAGLASLLSAVRLPEINPKSGEGMELQVIAAVVVGGVAISGGRGTLTGVLLGVILLGTIRSFLVFLRVEAQWDKALQGAIILLAVASDALNLRRRKDAGVHSH